MGCKNKNILITGISGFVGSLLARELIDEAPMYMVWLEDVPTGRFHTISRDRR